MSSLILEALIIASSESYYIKDEFAKRQLITLYRKCKINPSFVDVLCSNLSLANLSTQEIIDKFVSAFQSDREITADEILDSPNVSTFTDVADADAEICSALEAKKMLLLQLEVRIKTAELAVAMAEEKLNKLPDGAILEQNVKLTAENLNLKAHIRKLENIIENHKQQPCDLKIRIANLEDQLKYANKKLFAA